MTKPNELSINTGAAIGNKLLPDLFHDIDLEGLNNAIENIARVNKELEPEEKALARDIITDWNESVVGRLKSRENEMRGVIAFFNARSDYEFMNGQSIEDFGPELAAKTGTTTELDEAISAIHSLDDLQNTNPERPVLSKEDTFEERVHIQKEYDTKKALYQMDVAKSERKKAIAIGKFKRALLANKDVQTLVNEAKKSVNGTDKLIHMTKEKGQLAKLNISISSEKARDALKELLSFTTNI